MGHRQMWDLLGRVKCSAGLLLQHQRQLVVENVAWAHPMGFDPVFLCCAVSLCSNHVMCPAWLFLWMFSALCRPLGQGVCPWSPRMEDDCQE